MSLIRCKQLCDHEVDRNIFPILLHQTVRTAQRVREVQGVHVFDEVFGQSARTFVHDTEPKRDTGQRANQKRAESCPIERASLLSAQAHFVNLLVNSVDVVAVGLFFHSLGRRSEFDEESARFARVHGQFDERGVKRGDADRIHSHSQLLH